MSVTRLETGRPTQKARILAALKLGPVCGTDFHRWYIGRGAARILELREEGYQINTRPCTIHDWHESPQVVYELAEHDMDQLRFGI